MKTLRIDVPQALAGKFKNLTTATMHEQQLEPQPADVPAGYVAFQFAGDGELLGSKADSPELGEPAEGPAGGASRWRSSCRICRPHGVDRAWGQIAASKAETIEISVDGESKGLRPIDPQRDLMPGADVERGRPGV